MLKVKNHRDFACFDYISTTSKHYKLGDVVFKVEDNEVGVIIQIHDEREFRSDMFGNFCVSEVKPAKLSDVKKYRNDLLNDLT